MPIITIEMLDGRSEEMKLSLVQDVTDAVSRSLNIDKEEVDIVLKEVKRKDWAKGGVPWPWGRTY
jgi:4-oxalocrotonate tautomerase